MDVAAPGAPVHYYFSDHLGSADVITNADGSVIEEESVYYPFGGELAVTLGPNHFKFTGKERDPETGLDYFIARHYTSDKGRFLQPDEFTGGPVDAFSSNDPAPPGPTFYADLTNPQSVNKYAYTYDNPLRFTDPDGHGSETALGPFVCTWCAQVAADFIARGSSAVKDFVQGAAGVVTDLTLFSDHAGVNLPPSNVPNTPAGQAGALTTTVGLSMVGGGTAEGSLSERAKDIHSRLDPIAQEMRTTAVGETADGSKLVSTSSRTTLTPAQRAALQPGEQAVKGAAGSHAEAKILDSAKQAGQKVQKMAVTRQPCPTCSNRLNQNNVKIDVPKKP